MGLIIRLIFYSAIAYFVWRMLDSVFGRNKSGGSGRPNQNNSQKGKMHFDNKPQDKPHIPDSEGDYIDYEDVK